MRILYCIYRVWTMEADCLSSDPSSSANYETLRKLLNSSVSQFPHLQNEANNTLYNFPKN